MSDRLRIVQVGDVAQVAPAIADALAARVEMSSVPLRQLAGTQRGLIKALAAPLRMADAIRVANEVRGLHPDVVHVHWVPRGVVGPLTGRPWVLHAHGDDIRALNFWRRAAFGPILRLADLVVVSTPDLLPFAPSNAELVPTPIPRLDVRAKPRHDVLVASAALNVKGSAIAFEALRRLAVARPGVRLAAQDGPAFERGPWERLMPTTKEGFHLRLAGARVVFGQFGVGALGIADLEAMALARPLLTWVRDGLYDDPPPIVSSRDPDQLAAGALKLLESDGERSALGGAGALWVRRVHDPERIATQLLSIYRRLAAR